MMGCRIGPGCTIGNPAATVILRETRCNRTARPLFQFLQCNGFLKRPGRISYSNIQKPIRPVLDGTFSTVTLPSSCESSP